MSRQGYEIPSVFSLRWTESQVESHLEGYKIKMKGSNRHVEEETPDEGPEIALQRKCEAWLKERGYPFVHDLSRKKNKAGNILDLHIYLPKGRHVVIEIKARGKKMTPEQIETFKKIMFLGHEIHEVRSFRRFLEIMAEERD